MKRGYTLIEVLVSLLLSSIILLLLYQILFVLNTYSIDEFYTQDKISEFQLKHFMLACNNTNVQENTVSFWCADEEHTLYFVNDKLIISSGTLILLEKISFGHFEQSDTGFLVIYNRNNHEKRWLIEQ